MTRDREEVSAQHVAAGGVVEGMEKPGMRVESSEELSGCDLEHFLGVGDDVEESHPLLRAPRAVLIARRRLRPVTRDPIGEGAIHGVDECTVLAEDRQPVDEQVFWFVGVGEVEVEISRQEYVHRFAGLPLGKLDPFRERRTIQDRHVRRSASVVIP